jgi:ABC-type antimicrobial peptide transport system permease subunit
MMAIPSGFFGVLALLLAGLGLYGVTTYSVVRRRPEIGIGKALGGSSLGIIRLVLFRVALLVTIGAVVGVAASVWMASFVATLLYGLEPRDAATLIGAVVALVGVGLMAGAMPAIRAARIDPAAVLRES